MGKAYEKFQKMVDEVYILKIYKFLASTRKIDK